MRLLPQGIGLASVDAATPQLGIALDAEYRGQGYGKSFQGGAAGGMGAWLRARIADGTSAESGGRIVQACGFSMRGLRGTYYLMIAERAG